jgi:hypothetical protein
MVKNTKYEKILSDGFEALAENISFHLLPRWWDVFNGIPDEYLEEVFWEAVNDTDTSGCDDTEQQG